MSDLAKIKFGTDGWRAVIAREYTFANLERVTQAYSDYLNASKKESLLTQLVDVGQISKTEANDLLFTNVVEQAVSSSSMLVIVGYDRRFLSEMFAERAAEVLAGNDLKVLGREGTERRRRCRHHGLAQPGGLQWFQDQGSLGRQCGAGNDLSRRETRRRKQA